ncbi:MAG: glycosyltransferase family 2 protein [Candidatus Hydrogenedentes bacterium]|nr:glycosyltransferase family 2 protein [Candidatus Hydrogenedentota bacterium]
MRLLIVIPAFNEAKRIGDTLARVEAYLARQAYDSQVMVVDDGSSDDTLKVVADGFPKVRRVECRPNRGKGLAVRTGMLASEADYRVFYDADGSTPIEELEKLWPRFDAGADVVIGSRALAESDVAVPQVWYRTRMGRFFNILVRRLALSGVLDTQCGFKGFTAEACNAVFPRQSIDGFAFDVEVLYIAAKQGLRIDEIPVRWEDSPASSVGLVGGSLSMFIELLAIRLRGWRGRYGAPPTR